MGKANRGINIENTREWLGRELRKHLENANVECEGLNNVSLCVLALDREEKSKKSDKSSQTRFHALGMCLLRCEVHRGESNWTTPREIYQSLTTRKSKHSILHFRDDLEVLKKEITKVREIGSFAGGTNIDDASELVEIALTRINEVIEDAPRFLEIYSSTLLRRLVGEEGAKDMAYSMVLQLSRADYKPSEIALLIDDADYVEGKASAVEALSEQNIGKRTDRYRKHILKINRQT